MADKLKIDDILPNAQANGTLTQQLAKYLLGEIVGYDDDGNMLDASKYYNKKNILAAANENIAKGMDASMTANAAKQQVLEGKRLAPFYTGNIDNAKFGNWASLALGAAKNHPFKTAGLIGLGAGNIGGLTDNDKFAGQIGGLGLGGLGAAAFASNPYTAALMTMGGGQLGALFDKLRARKEQEQAQPQQQYYGGR